MTTSLKPVMIYLDEETVKSVEEYCWQRGYTRTDKTTKKTVPRLGTGIVSILKLHLSKYLITKAGKKDKTLEAKSEGVNFDLKELEKKIAAIEERLEEQEKEIQANTMAGEFVESTSEALTELQNKVNLLFELVTSINKEPTQLEEIAEIVEVETNAESTIKMAESTMLEEKSNTPRWKDPIIPHLDIENVKHPKKGALLDRCWIVEEYNPDYSFRCWLGGRQGKTNNLEEARSYSRKNSAGRAIAKLQELNPNRLFKLIPAWR
jgi:chromosome segregation ATPase